MVNKPGLPEERFETVEGRFVTHLDGSLAGGDGTLPDLPPPLPVNGRKLRVVVVGGWGGPGVQGTGGEKAVSIFPANFVAPSLISTSSSLRSLQLV